MMSVIVLSSSLESRLYYPNRRVDMEAMYNTYFASMSAFLSWFLIQFYLGAISVILAVSTQPPILSVRSMQATRGE
jgi:hypothetical protein